MTAAFAVHCTGRHPRVANRVVQFGGARSRAAAGDEDDAVGEHRGRVPARAWPMFAATGQDPVAGSYSSTEASGSPALLQPPVTSIVPSGNSVAVWPLRASAIDPVAAHDSVAGS